MATPLVATSEGTGENSNANQIDYVELLKTKLKENKLIYIADIIFKIYETRTRADLIQLMGEINTEDNGPRIHHHKLNHYFLVKNKRNPLKIYNQHKSLWINN